MDDQQVQTISAIVPSTLLYNRVCGQVNGYQFGHTDAFSFPGGINQRYVDGVSITHGNPRSHIWTLAAGHSEDNEMPHGCPREGGPSAPSFVGDNYFCESGNSPWHWFRFWFVHQ